MLALYSACRVGEKQLIRAAKGDVLRDEGGRTCQRFGLNKFEASLQRLKNIYAHVCVENNTERGREKNSRSTPHPLARVFPGVVLRKSISPSQACPSTRAAHSPRCSPRCFSPAWPIGEAAAAQDRAWC